MLYIASVKDNNEIKIIKSEYKTKKEFARDLRANGYKVRFIATEETFDKECENYYWRLEKAKKVAKGIRDSRKRTGV